MQYDNYQQKVNKIVAVIGRILAHLTLIIIVASVLAVGVIAYIVSKGTIYGESECLPQVMYGESVGYTAKGFLSEVRYEYCRVGEDEWSEEMPTLLGQYKVRAVTQKTFGRVGYGEEHTFTLMPKSVELKLADSVVYGEDPVITADLAYDDIVVCENFIYSDRSALKTSARVDKESVRILSGTGEDVTDCYEIEAPESSVTVTPRTITIAVTDAEKVYDGKALSSTAYEIVAGGLAYDDILTMDFTASQINVGETENLPYVTIRRDDGTDITSILYNVSVTPGKLAVTKRPIRITTETADLVYNGKPQSAMGFTVDPDTPLPAGEYVSVVAATKAEDCGSYENLLDLEVINGVYEKTTENYELTVISGTVNITPAPLTVRSAGLECVYDGKVHTPADYTCIGLIDGHITTSSFFVVAKDAGMYVNEMEIFVWEENGGSSRVVTENYSITYEFGTVVISKRPLTVTTYGNTWTYDAQEHEYMMFDADNLVEDHVLIAGSSTTIKNVGQTNNTLQSVVIVRSDNASVANLKDYDLSANYEITYSEGILEILPRPITVKPERTEGKIYDGLPVGDVSHIGIEVEGLVEHHTFEGSVRIDGENRVDAGDVYLVVDDFAVFEETENVTSNYLIQNETETYSINPRPIAVMSSNAQKRYDATPLVCHDVFVMHTSEYTLLEGHTVIARVTGSQTEVGYSANVFDVSTVRVFNADGNDITYNYVVSDHDFGILEVTHAALILVKSNSDSKIYDGTPLTNSGYAVEIKEGSLISGHYIASVTTTGSIINVGVEKNTVTLCVQDSEGKDVTHLYDVVAEPGDLRIEQRPITVYTGSKSWVYNGEYRKFEEFAVAGLLEGHDSVATSFSQIKNVWDAGENRATVEIYDSQGNNITFNYRIINEFGYIQITPKPVLLYPKTVSKVYDGTELSAKEVIAEGLVGTHKVHEYTIRGYAINVGEEKSSLYLGTVKIVDDAGVDVTRNYNLSAKDGSIIITPRPIIVTSEGAVKNYDGTPLTCDKMAVAESSQYDLVANHIIKAFIYGQQTEVGKSPNLYNTVSVKVLHRSGDDVSYNYDIVGYETGTLEVLPIAELLVSTESAIKYYDGQPLQNHNHKVSVQSGALMEGHSVVVDVTGTITEVGSTENIATVRVLDGDGNDVSALYGIGVDAGTLVVIEKGDEPEDMKYGEVYTAASELLYLRMNSYGDFINNEWVSAPEYGKTLPGGYSYNYLSSFAMNKSGMTAKEILFSECIIYMLPYYMGFSGDYKIPLSDTVYSNIDLKEYSVFAYLLPDYVESVEALKGMLGELSDEELAYREFVYRNYLNVDQETALFLQRIIFEQGFSKSSATVIADVARYIQKAAKYNLDYNPVLDIEDNVVIAFLDKYKEGICRHYASAATLLYRALGIPARYVEGFSVTTAEGEWTEIRSPGHAWVEVYVDGVGWISVEVTGGSAGNSSAGGGMGGGGMIPEMGKQKLEITPEFVYKKYDGTWLYAVNRLEMTEDLLELIEMGYTYSVDISGQRLEIGTEISVINQFVLYDPNHKNVTENFDIIFNTGKIRVIGDAINVILYQLNKVYDGITLTFEDGDYFITRDLPTGVTVDLKLFIELDSVGMITLSEINANPSRYISYRVYLNGVDITNEYSIVFSSAGEDEGYIPIRVEKRVIELTSESATAEYSGKPLTNDKVYISKGTLAAGHTLKATATGSIENVGSTANTIDPSSVVILDENGNDVTCNYEIVLNEGTLTLE